MANRIYFDHASATPLRREVFDAMRPFLDGPHFARPSELHAEGRTVADAIEHARAQVARLLDVDPEEIVFTSGGTEAMNLAVKGAALARRLARDRALASNAAAPSSAQARPRIVTSQAEPLAVVHALDTLARDGIEIAALPVTADCVLEPALVRAALTDATLLVVTHHGNPEVGVLQPVAELAQVAHTRGIPIACDATASAGLVPFDARAAGADLLAISAHRFGGPKGIGALRIAPGVRVRPLIEGGTQEWGLRAGTEHVAGIAGMGAAAEIALAEMARREPILRKLTAALRAAILRADPAACFSSGEQGGIPGYVHASFSGVDGEALASLLDAGGVAASTGSACVEGTGKPSHVLLAMGLSAEEARGSLLLTLATSNTGDEVERFGAILARALTWLRAISPPPHA